MGHEAQHARTRRTTNHTKAKRTCAQERKEKNNNKKDDKLLLAMARKLRPIGGKKSGVVGSGNIEKTLKEHGLTIADLLKIKA